MLIKSKTEAFFLSLNVAFFFFHTICLPVANKQKNLNITSAKEKMFSETLFWSKKDIIPQPKIMFSEKAFGRKKI